MLPYAKRRMVGPFIFFDHMGPVDFPSGIPRSVDVRPHPHIGLSTVTYLFAGEIMHRDSVGSEQAILPGEVNWMTAGRGITHSERFEAARRSGGPMHGMQAWVALPKEDEETEPAFFHHGAADLPTYEGHGLWARLIAGEAFGAKAAVKTHSPLFYVHWQLQPGAKAELPAEYPERAAYIVTGSVEVEGRVYEAGRMLVFPAGSAVTFTACNGGHDHAARRRAGGRAVHRLEFRIVIEGAHRAGQGRLARRADEAARPGQWRVRSAAGGGACESGARSIGKGFTRRREVAEKKESKKGWPQMNADKHRCVASDIGIPEFPIESQNLARRSTARCTYLLNALRR